MRKELNKKIKMNIKLFEIYQKLLNLFLNFILIIL